MNRIDLNSEKLYSGAKKEKTQIRGLGFLTQSPCGAKILYDPHCRRLRIFMQSLNSMGVNHA